MGVATVVPAAAPAGVAVLAASEDGPEERVMQGAKEAMEVEPVGEEVLEATG
jgi:hypothetical protein